MTNPVSHARRRYERRIYKLCRGLVRVLTMPLRRLPEGNAKACVRRAVLTFQHSLPTEFTVNRGETVVQVGTPNPGTVRRFARAVGPTGRVVIVEAMPENQERLAAAAANAGLDNVDIVRAAACNENGEGELAVSPIKGDHRIPIDSIEIDNDRRPENAVMSRIRVDFVRLDDALPRVGVESVDYLSVTVNGAEAEVLKGSQRILRNSPPWTRVYAKGHALGDDGRPIHHQVEAVMRDLDFRSKVTRGEPSSADDGDRRRRAGDLFAWKAN